MNSIEPFPIKLLENEVSHSLALAFTLFLGVALGGYYFMDTLKQLKVLEERVNELESSTHDTETLEEANSQTLHDMEMRIREKQDYDESNEIEEGKLQAWEGLSHQEYKKIEITLWQEKDCSIKENQVWTAWDGEKNSSTVVRDFYVGNLHPEFLWNFEESDSMFRATVEDTFINAWDSVIKIKIIMTVGSKKDILDFTEQNYWNGNPTINLALKKYIETDSIQWKRVLIDSDSVL